MNLTTMQRDKPTVRRGPKEILTRDLALKIVEMIEIFPDSGIEVSWDNVIIHAQRLFGLNFHRNTLSQKKWSGKKLISIAFDDAKKIQAAQLKDNAPKYADSPRKRLRIVISQLQSANIVLRQQLKQMRAQQYSEVFHLLDVRTPLHNALKEKGAISPNADDHDAGETIRRRTRRKSE